MFTAAAVAAPAPGAPPTDRAPDASAAPAVEPDAHDAASDPAVAAADAGALAAGIAAYRRGEFLAAQRAFEAAAALTPDDPVVRFNLGLTLYRRSEYAAARAQFERLRADPDMRSIANYHLGLIAARTGDTARARVLLAEAATEPDRVGALARAALGRLAPDSVPRDVRAYALAGLGFDDNRTRLDPSAAAPGRDPESWYTDLVAQALAPTPWRGEYDVIASVFRRDYATDNVLDQSSLQLALRRTWRPGALRLSAAVEGESILLRGNDLVNSSGVGLEATRRLGSGTLRLRYQPAHIQAEGDFDYLDGWRHRASLAHEFALAGATVRAGWEYEQSGQGEDLESDIVYGQAPHRHGPFLRVTRPLGPGLEITARGSLRQSRYDPETPAVTRRTDDLVQLGLALRLQVRSGWSLMVEYRYSDNASNVDVYDYDRTTLLGGVEWRY